MWRTFVVFLTAVCAVIGLVGCETTREKQMQQVAKDWAVTIRASQIIPVYPLTEDLQPGDIFLVTTTIPEQQDQYEEKGFLPLDMYMGRLSNLDYNRHYESAYGIGNHTNTPHHWKNPREQAVSDDDETNAERKTHLDNTRWNEAPRAAFPSYTFKVKKGQGIKIAIPVQGVPVGLSLMQANSAVGSITISDSYVYGLPLDELKQHVVNWARPHRALFKQMNTQKKNKDNKQENQTQLYLRVVNRVYLAGSVNVSLINDSAAAAKASAGVAKDVELPMLKDTQAQENYSAALTAINRKLKKAMPGGTIVVAHATSLSIQLSERFPRPLAIGYLGFDFPILEEGSIAAPIATLHHIEGNKQPIASDPLAIAQQMEILMLKIAAMDDEKQKEVYDNAAVAIGGTFSTYYSSKDPEKYAASVAFSMAEADYLSVGGNPIKLYRHLLDAYDTLNLEE